MVARPPGDEEGPAIVPFRTSLCPETCSVFFSAGTNAVPAKFSPRPWGKDTLATSPNREPCEVISAAGTKAVPGTPSLRVTRLWVEACCPDVLDHETREISCSSTISFKMSCSVLRGR
jgi:hypothetical protein